jgi:hypothetical protein
VAEHGPAPARQHGRQLTGALDRDGVSDQVDAAVDGVEPSRSEPMVDGARSEPDAKKLRAGHDAALPPGQLRDRPLTSGAGAPNDNPGFDGSPSSRVDFTPHVRVNPGVGRSAPS